LIEANQWTFAEIGAMSIKQLIIYSEYLGKKSKETKRKERTKEMFDKPINRRVM